MTAEATADVDVVSRPAPLQEVAWDPDTEFDDDGLGADYDPDAPSILMVLAGIREVTSSETPTTDFSTPDAPEPYIFPTRPTEAPIEEATELPEDPGLTTEPPVDLPETPDEPPIITYNRIIAERPQPQSVESRLRSALKATVDSVTGYSRRVRKAEAEALTALREPLSRIIVFEDGEPHDKHDALQEWLEPYTHVVKKGTQKGKTTTRYRLTEEGRALARQVAEACGVATVRSEHDFDVVAEALTRVREQFKQRLVGDGSPQAHSLAASQREFVNAITSRARLEGVISLKAQVQKEMTPTHARALELLHDIYEISGIERIPFEADKSVKPEEWTQVNEAITNRYRDAKKRLHHEMQAQNVDFITRTQLMDQTLVQIRRECATARLLAWNQMRRNTPIIVPEITQSLVDRALEVDISQIPLPGTPLQRRALVGAGAAAAVGLAFRGPLGYVAERLARTASAAAAAVPEIYRRDVEPQIRRAVSAGLNSAKDGGSAALKSVVDAAEPHAEKMIEYAAPTVNEAVGDIAHKLRERLAFGPVVPLREIPAAIHALSVEDVPGGEPPQKVENYVDNEPHRELLAAGIVDLIDDGRLVFIGDEPPMWSADIASKSDEISKALVAWLSTNAIGPIDKLNPENRREGSLYRPKDVAGELLTYALKQGILTDLCRTCDGPDEQWEIFQERLGLRWIEEGLTAVDEQNGGTSGRKVSFSENENRISIVSGYPAEDIRGFLSSRVVLEEGDEANFNIIQQWIAEQRSGFVRTEVTAAGTEAVFDPRTIPFVMWSLRHARAITLYRLTVDSLPESQLVPNSNQELDDEMTRNQDLQPVGDADNGIHEGDRADMAPRVRASYVVPPAIGAHMAGDASEEPSERQAVTTVGTSAEVTSEPSIQDRDRMTRRGFFRWAAARTAQASLAAAAIATGAVAVDPEHAGIPELTDKEMARLQIRLEHLLEPIPFSHNIVSQDGELLRRLNVDATSETDGAMVRWPATLDRISPLLQQALVAVEDESFYTHPGIDSKATVRALKALVSNDGEVTQGASTITQQLVRSMAWTREERERELEDSEAMWRRKLEEMTLALMYEDYLAEQLGSSQAAKNHIMERYLNTRFWGRNAHSAESAAHAYYGKNAADLTLGQAACLAGMLQEPYTYSQNPDKAFEKRNYVLGRMLETGKISKAQHDEALKEELGWIEDELALFADPEGTTYFATTRAFAEIEEAGLPLDGEVELTLEHGLQVRVRERLRQQIAEIERKFNIVGLNGACLVFNAHTGEIESYVANIHDTVHEKDMPDSQLDLISSARISPGSTTKPAAAVAIVEALGLRRSSRVVDAPVRLVGAAGKEFVVTNWDGKETSRQVTFAQALSGSLNTIFVRFAHEKSSPIALADVYERLGITSYREKAETAPDECSPDMPIGGGLEVTLMELAGLYGTLANGGKRVRLHMARKVGNQGIESDEGVQVISEDTAREITAILTDEKARRIGYGSVSPVYGFADGIAVKTGTAQGAGDNTVRNLLCAVYDPKSGRVMIAAIFDPDGKTLIPDKPGNRVTAGQHLAPMLVDLMAG